MDTSTNAATTIAAYEQGAEQYRLATAEIPAAIADAIGRFVADLSPGAEVLEIGSGPGRDAAALEAHGVHVRRTDITGAFVDMMRADGHEARILDPLIDELGGPYDGVWCNAVILHLSRPDARRLTERLFRATKPGGKLFVSAMIGDGDAWSTTGNVDAPRHFTYWREGEFRDVMLAGGWAVDQLREVAGAHTGGWLHAYASRPSGPEKA